MVSQISLMMQPFSRRKFLKLTGVSLGSTLSGANLLNFFSKSQLPSSSSGDEVNLDFKIGQMLLAGFRGLTVNQNHPIIRDIESYHLGGVILFDYDIPSKKAERNIKSPLQVKKLVGDLQTFATKLPLFVAIDYEGGKINRLSEQYGFPPTLSHQELGSLDNLQVTYRQANLMAETLADMGINVNFAPVVDVKVNPDNPVIGKWQRSFSADPRVVSRHAISFIKAHRTHGIICVPKHFPGHGSSSTDSHLGLADVTKNWSFKELQPYFQIFQEGLAEAIMTAHMFNARLDDHHPATLSKPIISGLLRGQQEVPLANSFLKNLMREMPLNFQGLILSDDIRMKAITSGYGFPSAIQKAIEAGIDIIIMGNNNSVFEEGLVGQAVNIIKQLVNEGTLSEARIDESYQRIRRLKHTLKL